MQQSGTNVDDGTVENPNQQISLTDARKIDSTYEVGEEVAEEIKLADFGRRAVLSLRQNLASRIMDLEKANLFNKYTEKVGEIITGEVYQVWKKEILVLDDDDNELVLPKSEQIPSDFFRKGESVKAIVARVEMKNNSPYIVLSRTAPEFLERLFEMEVPEIYDGLITIKKIVRIPGERAKVAVESYDDRVDPVGALRGHERFAHLLDCQGAAQREYRRRELDVQQPAADPAGAESGEDLLDQSQRGDQDGQPSI